MDASREPPAECLPADAPGGSARRLFRATRPAFFTAAVMPVLVGTAWGAASAGHLDPAVAALAILAIVLVHAGANVLNDVADALNGTDAANVGRITPYTGGSRMIQDGLLSTRQMALWGVVLVCAALLAGAALAVLRGLPVVWMGLAGLALGLAYSLPPLRLASRGLGESAVAVAFGVLPVLGSAWLQSGAAGAAELLLAMPVALYVASILLINEVPDIEADASAGKRTLAVRLGIPGTRALYTVLQLMAAGFVLATVLRGDLHWAAAIGPTALLGVALRAADGIRGGPASRDRLRAAIESTLRIHLLGSLWLAASAALAFRA